MLFCDCVTVCRYNTVMTPVVTSLQQHIAALTASEPVSPDDANFRQEMIPQLTGAEGGFEPTCVTRRLSCCAAWRSTDHAYTRLQPHTMHPLMHSATMPSGQKGGLNSSCS